MIIKKTTDQKKLHKRLDAFVWPEEEEAEGGKLRIYRVCRGPTRCVVCATAIVDPRNRRVFLKTNPSLKRRMEDPEKTNGKPMCVQYWLQEDTGQLIGPCGAACGPKAVENAWMKERRDEIRQQLLAAGVPSAEVEARLEQIAHQEWLNMLKVYREAEKAAKKLKIDTTSMTVDEIVAAVKKEKEYRAFKREVEFAQHQGIPVQLTSYGADVGGAPCKDYQQVRDAIRSWEEQQHKVRNQAAVQMRQANRAKCPDHVAFIEWAQRTTEPGTGPNQNSIRAWDRDNLNNALTYIDLGRPYPKTLQATEEIAVRARGWAQPWTGRLGSQPSMMSPAQGVGPQGVVGLTAGPSQPKCPACGRALARRSGYSNKGRHYDFYGCTGFPKCKGSMEVRDYEKALQGTQVTMGGPLPSTPPVIQASKAVAALQAQAAALGVKTPDPRPQEEEEIPETPKKKVKRQGFWS
jgi:ssDNA-binding Zn-finger/Zn-ribbon topoisomerase 1